MKLARTGAMGVEWPGVLDAEGVIWRLPATLGDIDAAFWDRDALSEVRRLLDSGELTEVVSPDERLGSPIAKPEKIICIGLNYRDHALESGSTVPDEPIIFMKAPNCIVGPNDDVLIPRGSLKTDWEVELGVVIGAKARYVEKAEALKHVAGYCVVNDVSEREFQLERGGQWDKGKSCETFNPLGPWLVTADEIKNPQDLSLQLSVNGVTRQDGTTADMIFDVAYLVWYLSQFMVLEPGDLINTGTPKGVSLGHDDVPYLRAGDVVELAAANLGTQRSTFAQA
jgi:2-keto-4-pentenoate hydratase/2-oxohepta-3-ene-1,7-dioic acid hydratase in catechol pathway